MQKPTYKELERTVLAQQRKIAELELIIQRLQERIASLETKLGKNSKNSSKSPSSDQKANNLAENGPETQRPHHPGVSRQLLPPDMVTSQESRVIDQCPRCRSHMAATGHSIKWQQVDIPPLRPLVHEIELCTCKCTACGLERTPELASHETFLMGPNLEGFINLLMAQFRHSHLLVRSFISMLIPGLKLSQGLISKVKRRGAQAFDGAAEQLLREILSARDTKFMDATGWRHKGRNWQTLLVRTPSILRYIFRDNQNSMTIAEILPKKVNHLVTDRGLATQKVDIVRLQYCLAHFLRNIQGMAEDQGVHVDESQILGEIHALLQDLFHDRHRYERTEIGIVTWRQYSYQKWAWMRQEFNRLLEMTSFPSLKRFCKRALKDWRHFMVYLAQDGPMTNNLAEEGLRNLVIARKLCFGSRSTYGLHWREVVHSCVETLKRQGKSMLDFFAETIRAFRMGYPCPQII